MEKRSSFQNLMGEFLTVTVVSLIASGFFQILVPNSLALMFGVFWAVGLAGWLYSMIRRSPQLSSSALEIWETIHPAKPKLILKTRCRYCKAMLEQGSKCSNCGAIQ